MTDLSVIILTKNEKLHIERCLERLRDLNPRRIFVVDCFSTDGSDRIAAAMGATVVQHKWPGNQAKQFNWALDSLPIQASWVLRLDADEYLYSETIEEVKRLLPQWDGEKVTADGLPPDVTSLSLSRARVFCGRRIRFGNPEIELVRCFKFGFGRSSQSEMDEHIVTNSGVNYKLKGKFVDHSLISMDEWREKHRNYARREARMAVSGNANANKKLYYKLPRYLRVIAYFSLRYFIFLGFLDGYAGWMWHFWQGLWYRWLVDCEIARLKG
ncbi:MAG: glycosyltransferase family 2 protein [Kiritimatiellia bacterium]